MLTEQLAERCCVALGPVCVHRKKIQEHRFNHACCREGAWPGVAGPRAFGVVPAGTNSCHTCALPPVQTATGQTLSFDVPLTNSVESLKGLVEVRSCAPFPPNAPFCVGV